MARRAENATFLADDSAMTGRPFHLLCSAIHCPSFRSLVLTINSPAFVFSQFFALASLARQGPSKPSRHGGALCVRACRSAGADVVEQVVKGAWNKSLRESKSSNGSGDDGNTNKIERLRLPRGCLGGGLEGTIMRLWEPLVGCLHALLGRVADRGRLEAAPRVSQGYLGSTIRRLLEVC